MKEKRIYSAIIFICGFFGGVSLAYGNILLFVLAVLVYGITEMDWEDYKEKADL